MPKVTIQLPSVLSEVMQGQRSVVVSADTVHSAIASLVEDCPELQVHIFDESGGFRTHVLCFHNDVNTRWLEDLNVAVNEGDTITILQAVSGG